MILDPQHEWTTRFILYYLNQVFQAWKLEKNKYQFPNFGLQLQIYYDQFKKFHESFVIYLRHIFYNNKLYEICVKRKESVSKTMT